MRFFSKNLLFKKNSINNNHDNNKFFQPIILIFKQSQSPSTNHITASFRGDGLLAAAFAHPHHPHLSHESRRWVVVCMGVCVDGVVLSMVCGGV